MDLLIAGGTVYDGTGGEPFVGDVGVDGGRIVAVGRCDGDAAEVFDATGLCVSAGFIDLHTHSDVLLAEPGGPRDAANHLRQGVTSIVGGNCGAGCVDVGAYFADLSASGVGVNVMHLVPHSAVREEVMGDEAGPPSPEQMRRMRALLRGGLEAGAVGMSTGLIYFPGAHAETAELIELARTVAEFDALYASHIRDEGAKLLDAVAEAIAIGRAAGCRVQISHFKTVGPPALGLGPKACGLIEQARAAGQVVHADQYPYIASSTDFATTVLPRWARADLQGRLDAGRFEPELLAEMNADLATGRAEQILIVNFAQRRDWQGKTLAELAVDLGLPAAEACVEVLKLGNPAIVKFGINEADAEYIAAREYVATGSDGSFRRKEGGIHPRSYGTFARKIADFARDRGWLSVARAVQSATGLPADILQLAGRGYVREGGAADLAVFDLDRLADNATYVNGHQYATGFRRVYVAGRAAVVDDEYTGLLAGTPLRAGGRGK